MSGSAADRLRPVSSKVEFIAGGSAALTTIFVVFPLHKTIFVQQLQGVRWTNSAHQVFVRDFRYLYRGVLPPMCQKTVSLAVMFGVYDQSKRALHDHFPSARYSLHKVTAALMAGSCEAILMPFERVQTLLQNRRFHSQFRNTFHTTSELWRAQGLREFYRGLTPILLRNGSSNVVYFLARELQADRATSSSFALSNFLSGAGLGACLGVATYQLNVAKTHMQTRVGGPFESVWSSLRAVYLERDRSLTKMYRGVVANCVRSMMSWGIITMSYEWYRWHLSAIWP